MHISNAETLVFDENGRCLSRAQEALWKLRRQCGWVCIAAEGAAAYIALSLAAQLPVDRLALQGGWISRSEKLPRELNRLRAFARRNMALVTAQLLLYDPAETELKRMLRGMPHAQVCVLREAARPEALLAPWVDLCKNNLLIPGKCV